MKRLEFVLLKCIWNYLWKLIDLDANVDLLDIFTQVKDFFSQEKFDLKINLKLSLIFAEEKKHWTQSFFPHKILSKEKIFAQMSLFLVKPKRKKNLSLSLFFLFSFLVSLMNCIWAFIIIVKWILFYIFIWCVILFKWIMLYGNDYWEW